jgi:transposase
MFLNYRRLQRLSAEVERYVCSAGLQSREVLETLHERYDGLLDESENHLNSRIQAIRVPARGYRNREHFKTAIYFHCGGLQLYPQTHGLPG